MATALEARLERALNTPPNDLLVHYERAACHTLIRAGYADSFATMHAAGTKEHWEVWAADALLFAIDALRAEQANEALRGWGQAREYMGRNGGFLSAGLADGVRGVQNALEKLLRDLGDKS